MSASALIPSYPARTRARCRPWLVARRDDDGNVDVERLAGEGREDDLAGGLAQAGAERGLFHGAAVDARRGHVPRGSDGGGDVDPAQLQMWIAMQRLVHAALQRGLVLVELLADL